MGLDMYLEKHYVQVQAEKKYPDSVRTAVDTLLYGWYFILIKMFIPFNELCSMAMRCLI